MKDLCKFVLRLKRQETIPALSFTAGTEVKAYGGQEHVSHLKEVCFLIVSDGLATYIQSSRVTWLCTQQRETRVKAPRQRR